MVIKVVLLLLLLQSIAIAIASVLWYALGIENDSFLFLWILYLFGSIATDITNTFVLLFV